MSSYNHDAHIIVYNYSLRDTELTIAGLSTAHPQVSQTQEISIGHAVTSITCSKTKSAPYGTFSITLKPTEEWTKKIVPGSWCAIYMSNTTITKDDLTNVSTSDGKNYHTPLKMVGIIMAVRISKSIAQDGAISITYTISGYDFGYLFTASVYVNQIFQAQVLTGKYSSVWSDISFPKDKVAIGDPTKNLSWVLQGWSLVEQQGIKVGASVGIKPPSTRIVIPDAVANLLGTEKEVIGFINIGLGLDKRKDKVIDIENVFAKQFKTPLIGQKYFEPHRLILNNTLWGMINEYLNPTLNEAYCDLHLCKPTLSAANIAKAGVSVFKSSGGGVVQPLLIMRQMPLSTPNYKDIVKGLSLEATPSSKNPEYPTTMLIDLPKTTIPAEKIIQYDIGYSEYERVNFTELNAYDMNVQQKSIGNIQTNQKPTWADGSINRLGLRPKVVNGVDYGFAAVDLIGAANSWRSLLRDWFFNNHIYVNGTVECIGLSEHIAIGENIVLEKEEILAHIESYTHSFTVDSESGLKIFRTSIDFTRGISTKSTSQEYIPVYGKTTIGGIAISGNFPGVGEPSIFEDDMKRSTFHPTKKE